MSFLPGGRRCDSCGTNGFSTSSPAFLELTGLKPDEVKVEWQYTSCAPYTTGSIRVRRRPAAPNHTMRSAAGGSRPGWFGCRRRQGSSPRSFCFCR